MEWAGLRSWFAWDSAADSPIGYTPLLIRESGLRVQRCGLNCGVGEAGERVWRREGRLVGVTGGSGVEVGNRRCCQLAEVWTVGDEGGSDGCELSFGLGQMCICWTESPEHRNAR